MIHAPCACNYFFELRKLPTIPEAHCALDDLWTLLKPLHHNTQASELSPVLRECLMHMKMFLWLYTDIPSNPNDNRHPTNPIGGHWTNAAD